MNDVERLWNLHRHAIVDACHFGVTIAADHPHDTVADRKDGDRRTYSDDFPRDFQAQKSGAAEVRTAVPASALGQVGTVQARGANADQKIGQPQFGFGYLGDLQDVGVGTAFGLGLYGAYPYYYDDYYPYYANDDYYEDSCYVVKRRVNTRYGWRVRPVQVCV
jgi:hypothetical protein